MFYVYKLLPSRRLELVRDKTDTGLAFINEDLALNHAAFLSTQNPYPYMVKRSSNLDGRLPDGRMNSMDPVYHYAE